MKLPIVFGMIGVGLLLLVLSGLWVTLFPGNASWNKEKAERWGEVKNRLHNLAFVVNAPPGRTNMHSGPELGKAKEEYQQLQKENEQLKAEFGSAYDSPRTAATYMKWGGISLAVVGLISWYAVKNS